MLYKYLRAQKTYRKRGYTNHDRRGQIANRLDIEDCATRDMKIHGLKNRLAENVSQTCIKILKAENPYTIIFNNGTEFAQHQSVTNTLIKRFILPNLTILGRGVPMKTPKLILTQIDTARSGGYKANSIHCR